MQLKVFLVDDEQKAISTLSSALTTFFDNVIICGTATNITDAYNGITTSQPHLVFLDVEMGTETGFQLLEKFEQVTFEVAFVTGHVEFALKAIKFSALDYILKPANISELKTLLSKVSRNLGSENERVKQMFGNIESRDKSEHKLAIPTVQGYEFIRVDHILYLSSSEGYSEIMLSNSKKMISSKSLKFYEDLLNDYHFYRIHHSSLINLRYVKAFYKRSGGLIKMENEEELEVARSRKAVLLELLSLR